MILYKVNNMSHSEPSLNPLLKESQQKKSDMSEKQVVEHLELLAEKADIQIDKHITGQLMIKKVVREQTIHIPVVLTEEVLVIQYQQSILSEETGQYHTTDPTETEHILRSISPFSIMINGESITFEDQQIMEIPLYHEQAAVHKKVVITEKVDIGKITQQRTETVSVLLRHEELDIQQSGNTGLVQEA